MMSSAQVLLDFDGTITCVDTVDRLLERFALPEWVQIEDEWRSGKIGARECLDKQTSLLRATPAALDALIDTIPIDAGLAALVRKCRDLSLDLLIVSDGYDRVIRRVLARAGLAIPFVSNVLRPHAADRWTFSSPASRADCRVGAGHCKCARVSTTANVVLIGDGRSDFCVAHAVEFVVAKGALAQYCTDRRLTSVRISDLFEAADALDSWIMKETTVPLPWKITGEIA
jgi:2-hydroxy-3-keto-5-methylthiopentenyl-1-phosphate phosphatase